MKTIQLIATVVVVLGLGPNSPGAAPPEVEGVALAIVYDTSGSMADMIRDGAGKSAPKYMVANRALEAIAKRLQVFAAPAAGGSTRKIHAGLFTFTSNGAREAVKFAPFDAKAFEAFQAFTRSFKTPNGGTPLGAALQQASQTVLRSGLTRKHVLIITDGMNTVGADPAAVMPGIKQQAEKAGAGVSVHFVAFDVDAQVFNAVKKQGANVFSAANEVQLNTQLEFIMATKILLEEEEPVKKK